MKNKELTRLVVITVLLFSTSLIGYGANYPIKLSFRDAPTDLFKSDGLRDSSYINGVDEITCLLVDETAPNGGDLSCYDSSRTNRKWCYPTNNVLGGYSGFCSTGQIRVKSVLTVGMDEQMSGLRAVVLRANNKQFTGGIAKFEAENLAPAPSANDLAYVEKLNDCQYRITMGTGASGNQLDIFQGARLTYRSTVPLPFQVTATIIGIKTGCSG